MVKASQAQKMIAKCEEEMAKIGEANMSSEAEAEVLKSIEEMVVRIERLNALSARVKALKGGK
jgi:hypothetical protein